MTDGAAQRSGSSKRAWGARRPGRGRQTAAPPPMMPPAAPGYVGPAGIAPPADWLAKVQQHAPHLLRPGGTGLIPPEDTPTDSSPAPEAADTAPYTPPPPTQPLIAHPSPPVLPPLATPSPPADVPPPITPPAGEPQPVVTPQVTSTPPAQGAVSSRVTPQPPAPQIAAAPNSPSEAKRIRYGAAPTPEGRPAAMPGVPPPRPVDLQLTGEPPVGPAARPPQLPPNQGRTPDLHLGAPPPVNAVPAISTGAAPLSSALDVPSARVPRAGVSPSVPPGIQQPAASPPQPVTSPRQPVPPIPPPAPATVPPVDLSPGSVAQSAPQPWPSLPPSSWAQAAPDEAAGPGSAAASPASSPLSASRAARLRREQEGR